MSKLKQFKLVSTLLCTSFLLASPLCADPPSDKGQKGKDKGSDKSGNGGVEYALDLSLLVSAGTVSYTHLTLPTSKPKCRSRWSPYH